MGKTIRKRGHRGADELFPHYSPNIFPAAWPLVRGWGELDWHPGAHRIRSSQALAIDVFGTIYQSLNRNAILDALAQELGLPTGGPWGLELESSDPLNELREIQTSPVDVVLRSPKALLFLECKFTERDGGVCHQTKGGTKPPQCNGHYEMQVNPRNGLRARCALTAKGIRYWELIPELFHIAADVDHHPCPFAGPSYQWMRILAICAAAARRDGLQAAVAVVYVDRKGLAMARKDWSEFRALLRPGLVGFHTLTFQRVLAIATGVAPKDAELTALTKWVEEKIARA